MIGGRLGIQPGATRCSSVGSGRRHPRFRRRSSTPGGVYQGPRDVAEGSPRRADSAPKPPFFGTLEIAQARGDAGPPDGLTLDQAIDLLIAPNLDLRAKQFEIPQARADVLTASLRANPIFYADSQLVPYGSDSVRRPDGPTQYDVNISHPIDYAHKRQRSDARREPRTQSAGGSVPE